MIRLDIRRGYNGPEDNTIFMDKWPVDPYELLSICGHDSYLWVCPWLKDQLWTVMKPVDLPKDSIILGSSGAMEPWTTMKSQGPYRPSALPWLVYTIRVIPDLELV